MAITDQSEQFDNELDGASILENDTDLSPEEIKIITANNNAAFRQENSKKRYDVYADERLIGTGSDEDPFYTWDSDVEKYFVNMMRLETRGSSDYEPFLGLRIGGEEHILCVISDGKIIPQAAVNRESYKTYKNWLKE